MDDDSLLYTYEEVLGIVDDLVARAEPGEDLENLADTLAARLLALKCPCSICVERRAAARSAEVKDAV